MGVTNLLPWGSIGHLFGIKHCVYYDCLMNGSNCEEENKKKPQMLCPICLRKFQLNVPFDIKTRYQNLIAVCKKMGGHFLKDAKRYEELLACCE